MERPTQLQKRKHGDPYPLGERLLRRRHIADSGCWEYLGARTPNGYGNINVGSEAAGTNRVRKVHVVAYELWIGPVPDGLELDHLCRNSSCFNPEHLEPVTHQENLRRAYPMGEPYKCGHLRVEENIVYRGNVRACRTCRNAKRREARRKAKDAQAA